MRALTDILAGASLAAVLALSSAPAFAESEWPGTKSVEIIVPAAPGGMVDIPSRIIADALARQTGGTFLINNKPGAGGTVGTQALQAAPADGHTILLISSAASIAPYLHSQNVGDPREDFAPISLVVDFPIAIVASNDSGLESFEDVLERSRSEPGSISYGTGGVGTGNHLSAELLSKAAEIEMLHVPYGGTSAVIAGLVANEVDLMFANLASAIGAQESGQGKILAIASAERQANLPDVPTVAEFVLDFTSSNWFGLVGRADFPEDVMARLQVELAKVLEDTNSLETARNANMELILSGPEPLAKLISDDYLNFGPVIEQLGI